MSPRDLVQAVVLIRSIGEVRKPLNVSQVVWWRPIPEQVFVRTRRDLENHSNLPNARTYQHDQVGQMELHALYSMRFTCHTTSWDSVNINQCGIKPGRQLGAFFGALLRRSCWG